MFTGNVIHSNELSMAPHCACKNKSICLSSCVYYGMCSPICMYLSSKLFHVFTRIETDKDREKEREEER